MRHFFTSRIAASVLAGFALPAGAASEDAWEAFRVEVEEACLALAEAPEDAKVTAQVNPFGSESYGAALVTVAVPEDDEGAVPGYEETSVCIFDKQDRTAELTGPFMPEDDVEAGTQ